MYGIPVGSRLVKLTLVNGCKLDYMFAPYDFRGNFINAVFGGTINVQYVLDWDYHSDDELELFQVFNDTRVAEHVKTINRNAQGVDYTARQQGDNK